MTEMIGRKMIDRSGPDEASTPLYQLVARTLQTEIVRGVYLVGAHLPSETELMGRFGVSRNTVRSAIRMLHDAAYPRMTMAPFFR